MRGRVAPCAAVAYRRRRWRRASGCSRVSGGLSWRRNHPYPGTDRKRHLGPPGSGKHGTAAPCPAAQSSGKRTPGRASSQLAEVQGRRPPDSNQRHPDESNGSGAARAPRQVDQPPRPGWPGVSGDRHNIQVADRRIVPEVCRHQRNAPLPRSGSDPGIRGLDRLSSAAVHFTTGRLVSDYEALESSG